MILSSSQQSLWQKSNKSKIDFNSNLKEIQIDGADVFKMNDDDDDEGLPFLDLVQIFRWHLQHLEQAKGPKQKQSFYHSLSINTYIEQ